jgi:NitT/TauT family transport system permease protein
MKARLERYFPLFGAITFLLIWQFVVMAGLVNQVLLPTPARVLQAVWHGFVVDGRLGYDFSRTVMRALSGIAMAIVIGIPIGLILGSSGRLYRYVEFVIDFFRSTPLSAVFPLFLVLFGVADTTKIYVAAFGASLAIIFNTAYGVMNARKTRLLAAQVMGANRLSQMLVVFFESLPQTIIGLRIGATLALVVIITAEMLIGARDGLGLRVFEEQQLFNMPGMYAAVFSAGVLGYTFNLIFRLLEVRFVHWTGK